MKKEVKKEMLQRCNNFSMIAFTIKFILIFVTVILTICALGSAIEAFTQSNDGNRLEEAKQEITYCIKEYSTDEGKTIKSGCKNIIEWVIIIFIFDGLHKMLKTTVKKETPFCEENIKNMDKLSFLVLILILTNFTKMIGVLEAFAIVILAVNYMFKYAYILQQESDETL